MSEQDRPNWSLLTRLVHEGDHTAPPPARTTVTPIYPTTTFLYPSAAALDEAFAENQFVYARYGNPTVQGLEQAMAMAEGGIGAIAFSSGMAALHTALLAAGTPRGQTHPQPRGIVASRDLYGATTQLVEEFFAAQGVPVAFCDMSDLEAVDAAIQQIAPDVLLVEQISNPLLRVVDIKALATRAKATGARLVVDSTMTTPILQRPLSLGADLVVHSATKYLGGHGDVIGGIVVARTAMVRDSLDRYSKLLGSILGPAEAHLLHRGIKTLALRMRQQCQNAAAIATWLQQQPQVAQVHYPGLPEHPQHELAVRDFGGLFGAMVTFELQPSTREATYRFVDSLRLILPGSSLGDVYSLVTVPLISSHRNLTSEQRLAIGIPDGLARLSIGIEDVQDLIEDLRGALACVASGA